MSLIKRVRSWASMSEMHTNLVRGPLRMRIPSKIIYMWLHIHVCMHSFGVYRYIYTWVALVPGLPPKTDVHSGEGLHE